MQNFHQVYIFVESIHCRRCSILHVQPITLLQFTKIITIRAYKRLFSLNGKPVQYDSNLLHKQQTWNVIIIIIRLYT